MQQLHHATKAFAASDACARELLDTVPLVMRVIRQHMRQHRSGLTVPQFRTLCYLTTSPESSLSAVADFIGLSLPAMSRLVDGLVEKRLISRRTCADDRRHLKLSVTGSGRTSIAEARQIAQTRLAEAVKVLTPAQRDGLLNTMKVLQDIFTAELQLGEDISPIDDAGAMAARATGEIAAQATDEAGGRTASLG